MLIIQDFLRQWSLIFKTNWMTREFVTHPWESNQFISGWMASSLRLNMNRLSPWRALKGLEFRHAIETTFSSFVLLMLLFAHISKCKRFCKCSIFKLEGNMYMRKIERREEFNHNQGDVVGWWAVKIFGFCLFFGWFSLVVVAGHRTGNRRDI